ncbi:enoyl-CoA hydratase-related protein [Tistrella mobilis]
MSRTPRLIHLLAAANRRVMAIAEAGLEDLGITTSQSAALFVLGERGPSSVTALGAALDLGQSATSTLVQKLETAGLVARTDDPADRRAVTLRLTERGEAIRRVAARRANDLTRRMAHGLSPEERAVIAHWLKTVGTNTDAGLPPEDQESTPIMTSPIVTDDIRTTTADGIMEIIFARPAKKNAITNEMYGAVADALESAEADDAIHVVLIRSDSGDFTAGNDLSDFAKIAAGEGPTVRHVQRVLKQLARMQKPVVAAVLGQAVGIGTTMLLHCDLVYVARDAKLSTPFVGLALVPEAASSLLLPAAIGHRRAFAMFALGEVLSGSEAAELGLVNAALPANDVFGAARAAAGRLAQQPIGAIKATKGLMRDAAAIATVMDTESRLFFERLQSPEAREAFTAFAERRKPDFTKLG